MTADERADTAGRAAQADGRRALFLGWRAFSSVAVGIMALAVLVFAVVMTTIRPGHHPPRLKRVSGPAPDAGNGSPALPGMPPPIDPHDLYAADRPGLISPVVKDFPSLVDVPNSKSDSLDVIDPTTFRIVAHYPVGRLPQHVVPSYDLTTLWVLNNAGDSITPIDPATGKPGRPVPVEDPYNL